VIRVTAEDCIYTVILKRKGKELDRWALSREPLTIGRSLDNDIAIDDRAVSRKHAVLQYIGDRYVITDCNSGNGVNINGTPADSAKLQDGDIIVLGDHSLFFQLTQSGEHVSTDFASLESTIRQSDGDTMSTIENPAHFVLTTELGEQTFALDRPVIVIGSDPDADIQVKGRLVAAYHADIVYSNGTYTLNHIEGRRKVTVDGRTVKKCVLTPDCVISIADTTLVFREAVRAGAGRKSD
jgi:pSer/pThr/pTyr-binding forkhead associated (FHA) protein